MGIWYPFGWGWLTYQMISKKVLGFEAKVVKANMGITTLITRVACDEIDKVFST